jgi:hypothetical protein
LGIKQLRHDVDHSPPSRAEVKNEWSYTSAPCICLQGMDREGFNFDLLNGGWTMARHRQHKQKSADIYIYVPSGIHTNDPSA